jgi:hypothetical protein
MKRNNREKYLVDFIKTIPIGQAMGPDLWGNVYGVRITYCGCLPM